jgi:two-component system, response regulator PdtaR
LIHTLARHKQPVVLVAEDEDAVLQTAFDMVADAGYTPLGAPNADHALRILQSRGDIRIVLIDVNMPGTMDGIQLAEVIRRRWPKIKLIVISGRIDLDTLDAPAGTRLVRKPYRFDEIANHLNTLAAA